MSESPTILHLPSKPTAPDRVSLEVRGILELGSGLDKLSKSIERFPETSLKALDSRLDLAYTSYTSGAFTGAGITIVIALLFYFLSRHNPKV